MVRKRTRTSRKYYESDDNDSDSDFALDDVPDEPAPKKYSLRQRKRALFIDDFDYEDDDEVPPPKASDDEDFEVEKELAIDEAPSSEYVDNSTFINHLEPGADDIPEDPDGLIDFEDMIRADIVVNKNRIDYDNVITKTEIKVQPIENVPVERVKSKRGRKPKVRPENEVDSSFLEPETEVQEDYDDKNDIDYNPNEDLENDLLGCVQTELSEANGKVIEKDFENTDIQNSSSSDTDSQTLENEPDEQTQPDSTVLQDPQVVNQVKEDKTHLPEIRNFVESSSPESVIKLNENFVRNSLQANEENSHAKNSETDLVCKQENHEDDDDVVLVEEKNDEVIVLDD